MTETPRKQTPVYSADRENRVAEALRENLRKRKAQQKAKTEKTTQEP